jgi:hypothetical protein
MSRISLATAASVLMGLVFLVPTASAQIDPNECLNLDTFEL